MKLTVVFLISFSYDVISRYRQIGNAVAVPVSRALGYALGIAHRKLASNEPHMTLPPKFSLSNYVQLSSNHFGNNTTVFEPKNVCDTTIFEPKNVDDTAVFESENVFEPKNVCDTIFEPKNVDDTSVFEPKMLMIPLFLSQKMAAIPTSIASILFFSIDFMISGVDI
jgi:hypothetical protein